MMSSVSVVSILNIISIILISLVRQSIQFDVRIYGRKQFEGRYSKLAVTSECVNLPDAWNKNVVSIDPQGCIILYADANCKGLRRRLDKWSWGCSDLKEISFDYRASSISPCTVIKKPVIPLFDEL